MGGATGVRRPPTRWFCSADPPKGNMLVLLQEKEPGDVKKNRARQEEHTRGVKTSEEPNNKVWASRESHRSSLCVSLSRCKRAGHQTLDCQRGPGSRSDQETLPWSRTEEPPGRDASCLAPRSSLMSLLPGVMIHVTNSNWL